MKDYIAVSFSGGKDSTAMLLRMIELGEHIDEVICCDTTKEFPAMYRHIEKVKKVVEDARIKFTIVKAEHDFDYYMLDQKIKRRNPEFAHLTGNSWPSMRIRWCTRLLKLTPIDNHFKELNKLYNVIHVKGLAADEEYRLERKNNKQTNHRHPLVEWGWTEADCLKYCYERGYDWEGLYEMFDGVSCFCCPMQPVGELRKLRKHFPELWNEMLEMDKKTWRAFKMERTLQEWEIRFQFEEERIKEGLSITNRDFHTKLKERWNDATIRTSD